MSASDSRGPAFDAAMSLHWGPVGPSVILLKGGVIPVTRLSRVAHNLWVSPGEWFSDDMAPSLFFLPADFYMGWLAEELICWRVDFLTVWFVERMNDSQHILGSEELLFRLKVTEFLVNKNKKILISRYLVFKKANYRIYNSCIHKGCKFTHLGRKHRS